MSTNGDEDKNQQTQKTLEKEAGYMMDQRGPGPFKEYVDTAPGPRWTAWKRSFELVMRANRIHGSDRAVWMLAQGGADIQRLNEYLPVEIEGMGEMDEYDKLVARLDKYFKPRVVYALEHQKFRSMEQAPNERMDSFVVRLREQGANCNYGDKLETVIVDQIISKARMKALRDKLKEKDYTLDEVQIIAAAMEIHETQEKPEVNRVGYDVPKRFKSDKRSQEVTKEFKDDRRTCFACGRKGHIASSDKCPAKGQRCHKCNRTGHFEKTCRDKKRKRNNDSDENSPPRKKSSKVNLVNLEEQYKVFCFTERTGDIYCKVGGVQFKMLIDSGADVDIISYSQWQRIKDEGGIIWDAVRGGPGSILKVLGSGNHVKYEGSFMTRLKIGEKEISARVFVIENGDRALLSRSSAIELGVLKLGPEINAVSREFNKIKGIRVEFVVDEKVKPVSQSYRRIPAPMEEKVNEKLDELLSSGIIEKVDKPSLWISAMVVEPKRNGDIRICVDMRQVNKAIVREKHPMPTIEEILIKVAGSVMFSCLDIAQSFHQVEIGESSRHLTTFITSKGLFQYRRLLFGISCAPEKFQKILESVLAGCSGCLNFIDDILVFGTTKNEHDLRLKAVIKRLKEFDILLNEDKCIYGAQEVNFLGFKLSPNGVNITNSKLEALRNMKVPQNVKELRGALGFFNFLKRFVPRMSTVCAPLNDLLRSDKKFEWTKTHQQSFEQLKQILTRQSTLGHYDPKDRTEVVADASPVGLGAVLIQIPEKGDSRVICYISRSLSDVERRYAQLEKEALALVWAVERLHYYLYGKRFYLVTDHRPLEVIFGPRSKPCLRIERWVLRLQSYDYEVVYRPGKENIADPFSRLCQGDPETNCFDEISEIWIRQVAYISRPVAITKSELEDASRDDKLIISVKNAIATGKWVDEAKRLEHIGTELCFCGDVLLRGTRIVIPASLQTRTIELAHTVHSSETAMKQLLRTKVWWPDIDQMVKRFVNRCHPCILNSKPEVPEPMTRRALPSAPWINVAADFLGPLPTGEYLLIVVDYYSRYQEIEIMSSITARNTVIVFQRIFGRCGYPVTMTTDNGPQFVSTELKNYCKEVGITLNNTIPYWPQQNGEVERQNRDVLKFIRTCQADGDDWKARLHEYILVKHSSVNATTNKSPAELFFKRSLRTKLPCIINPFENPDDEEVRDRDKLMKSVGKERADKDRRAKPSDISSGDLVYVKNFSKENKLDTNFSPELHRVISRNNSDVMVQSCDTKKIYRRNVVHLKKAMDVRQGVQVEEKGDELSDVVEDVGKLLPEQELNNEIQQECPREPIPKLKLKRSGEHWEPDESSRPKRSRNLPSRYRE